VRKRQAAPSGDEPVNAATIRSIEFHHALKGYNVDEVDVFLEAIANRVQNGQVVSDEELAAAAFHLSLRGYDVTEVDAYLDRIAQPGPGEAPAAPTE
jgi:DivIVA domain-containing protein